MKKKKRNSVDVREIQDYIFNAVTTNEEFKKALCDLVETPPTITLSRFPIESILLPVEKSSVNDNTSS